MIKAQSDTVIGTDLNVTLIVHCPSSAAIAQGAKCSKFSEFGGSSPSFLKTFFHGAAAGAAMGAGLALSGDEITGGNVSAEAEGGSASAGASASSRANATAKADAKAIQQQQRPRNPHHGGDRD